MAGIPALERGRQVPGPPVHILRRCLKEKVLNILGCLPFLCGQHFSKPQPLATTDVSFASAQRGLPARHRASVALLHLRSDLCVAQQWLELKCHISSDTFFYGHRFSFLVGKHGEVKLLAIQSAAFGHLQEAASLSPKWLFCFTPAPALHERPSPCQHLLLSGLV
jgi:hypothetical protein